MTSTHTISVLVENQSGSLSRIAGLFSARGYNISSLSVAETEDPSVSRMTIVVGGDDDIIEQIVKHLNRLIDVIKVMDFRTEPVIERELLIVRINCTAAVRSELDTLCKVYGAAIIAITQSSVTIQQADESSRVEEFIGLIRPYGIKEIVRSGKVALAKAKK